MSAVAVSTHEESRFTPIFFKDFDAFKFITKNVRQAEFLCRIYHNYQISKFSIEGKKCFLRSTRALAEECGVSVSTTSVYLRELEEKGLIRRVCKLYKTKKLYIFITKKLTNLLRKNRSFLTQKNDNVMPAAGISIYKDKYSNKNLSLSNTSNTVNQEKNANCCDAQKGNFSDALGQTAMTDNEAQYEPTVEELERSHNEMVKLYEQGSQQASTKQSKAPKQTKRKAVEQTIKQTLTPTQKKYIHSTVKNIAKQVAISKSEKLTQEIEAAITDPKRFSRAKSFAHRINTIAKCIRSGYWKNPVVIDTRASSDDVFRCVHVMRDSETGGSLIEAEQIKTPQQDPDFTAEDEAIWARLSGSFNQTHQAHITL